MTLQFTLKPYAIDAIGPLFFLWLWRYSVAAVIIYFLAGFTEYQNKGLIIALVVVVLVASVLSIKHALIKIHMTTYSFYDTHVVAQTGLVMKERKSLPYKQINQLSNSSSLWNRLTGASDITLKALNHSLCLRSIKNATEIEDKIYKILRSHKKS